MAPRKKEKHSKMNDAIPSAIAMLVIDVLEELGIPYVIGGSLASIAHGEIRNTVDADIVADIQPEHVSPFVHALESQFHVTGLTIVDAIMYRSSFNMVHRDTALKVDVFLPKPRAFDRMQLERRGREVIVAKPERTAWVASAEDTILAKLEWFRLGGETSERQWRDVLGVLKTQGDRIDVNYLCTWAAELGVSDLMEKALIEANREE